MKERYYNKTMIETAGKLCSLANSLDQKGLYDIADLVDIIVKRSAPLSEVERQQLGTEKDGSEFQYIDEERWGQLRDTLVSKKPSRSYVETEEFKYDPELTAYTPGEALDLLSHPKILAWFDEIEQFRIPDDYDHIILVPCAASKPWGANCPGSGKYYKAYHDIKEGLRELDHKAYWVTISEPLGIVPEDMWDSFPGYDVPGLFKDPSSRMSGMTTKQWKQMFGRKYSPPFDQEAYEKAVRKLGEVIYKFIKNNAKDGRRWISFIKGTKGKVTTHSEMMTEALAFLANDNETIDYKEYTKDKDEKGHPTRSRIAEHVGGIIQRELSSSSDSGFGFKVVSKVGDKFYSLQNQDLEYPGQIGSISSPSEGLFLGTTREFVTDYYSGLTDGEEVILKYKYKKSDVLHGEPDEEGEIKVKEAELVGIQRV